MKRKLVFCALLAAALLITLLAGCAAKPEEAAAEAVPAQASTPTKAPAPAPTEAPTNAPTAEPTPAPTPEPKMFPWLEQTLGVTGWSDDPDVVSAVNETPEGKFLCVELTCVGGKFAHDGLKQIMDEFRLRDANKTYYDVQFVGLTIEGSFSLSDMSAAEYSAIKPTFDVPADADPTTFTLCVPTGTAGETIIVRLSDVPPIEAEAGAEEAAQ